MSFYTREEEEYLNFVYESTTKWMLDCCEKFYYENSSKMNNATREFFFKHLQEMRDYYNDGQITMADIEFDKIKMIYFHNLLDYIK